MSIVNCYPILSYAILSYDSLPYLILDRTSTATMAITISAATTSSAKAAALLPLLHRDVALVREVALDVINQVGGLCPQRRCLASAALHEDLVVGRLCEETNKDMQQSGTSHQHSISR